MKTKKSLLILAGLLAVVPAWAATSVTQREITWTFSEDKQVGQYANGDYWVVGPVTITGISPASIVVGTRSHADGGTVSNSTINGSWVNPTAGIGGSQGFDSHMDSNSWDPAKNAGRPGGVDLSPANPLTLNPGASLVSTESKSTAGFRPQLTRAEILTVVAEAQPSGTMRPPYCGTDKTTWNVADFHPEVLRELPALPNMPALATLEGWFARPWIEIRTDDNGREMHPSVNQPDYGRDMAFRIGDALLALHFRTYEENSTLLIRMVQYGIDIYGAAKSGGHWRANGGHNLGRKGPLLLAGAVLAEPAILAYADRSLHSIFQEDQQTFTVSSTEVAATSNFTTRNVTSISVSGSTGTITLPSGQSTMLKDHVIAISGATPAAANGYWVLKNDPKPTSTLAYFNIPGSTIPAGTVTGVAQVQYYPGWAPDDRARLAPYTAEDIGMPEWGIKHQQSPDEDNRWWGAVYRDVACPPMPGHALFARLLFQGQTVWNWPHFFDYYDRYVEAEGDDADNSLNEMRVWVRDAWLLYRDPLEADDFEYADAAEATTAGLLVTGSPTFNYTTAPAPLQGAASVFCASAATSFRTRAFETSGDSSFYFQWYPFAAPVDASIVQLYDSSNVALGVTVVARHNGTLRIINDTTSTSTSVLFAPGTLYHVWVEYSPSPTASTVRIFLSTTGTKPASPTYSKTNGTATGALGRVRFQGASAAGQIFDKFRASDEWDIGSDPE